MKKLKLQLDDLVVDGFPTTPAEKDRGTVMGHSHYTWCWLTCPATCGDTCANTCDDYSCAESCGGTCWNPRCNDSNICP
jgi:hypothetical protein